jgi:hypothetical protein
MARLSCYGLFTPEARRVLSPITPTVLTVLRASGGPIGATRPESEQRYLLLAIASLSVAPRRFMPSLIWSGGALEKLSRMVFSPPP